MGGTPHGAQERGQPRARWGWFGLGLAAATVDAGIGYGFFADPASIDAGPFAFRGVESIIGGAYLALGVLAIIGAAAAVGGRKVAPMLVALPLAAAVAALGLWATARSGLEGV